MSTRAAAIARSGSRAICFFTALPSDPDRDVHGIFSRASTAIKAIASVVEQVDILAFVHDGLNSALSRREEIEHKLRARWTPKLKLSLCRRDAGPQASNRSLAHYWRAYFAGTFGVRWQSSFRPLFDPDTRRALMGALSMQPDLLFAQNLLALGPIMAAGWPTRCPPIAFDMPDIEHRVLARALVSAPATHAERLRLLWLPALFFAERRAARASATTLVCSEEDGRYVRRAFRPQRVRVIPNAVDLPDDAPLNPGPPRLLFVGALHYRPNQLAAQRLVLRIWPKVLASVPEAELWIVGQYPNLVAGGAEVPPSVRFLGFVNDIRGVYAQVRAVVCPIPYGGGTRVKIIEALAHGKAVISNGMGAEGLALTDGRDVLLRESDDQIANTSIDLLRDPDAAMRLGTNARALASRYSRPRVIEALAKELAQVLLTHPRSPMEDGRIANGLP